jgi:hypothetical protein
MITVNDLHPQAMDLAELAFLHRRKGDEEKAQALFSEALKLERQAAALLPAEPESEPSRSVLYRSAAVLAYNAGDYEMADWLIANGLAGFPPPEIKEELKQLYQDVNSRPQPMGNEHLRGANNLSEKIGRATTATAEIDAKIQDVIAEIDRQIDQLEFKKSSLLALFGKTASRRQQPNKLTKAV